MIKVQLIFLILSVVLAGPASDLVVAVPVSAVLDRDSQITTIPASTRDTSMSKMLIALFTTSSLSP